MEIAANRTHYLKWKLDIGDLQYSVRYHFLWQSKKDMENKYILKHHKSGTLSVITHGMAQQLIKDHGTEVEEIIASVHIQNDGTESKKLQNKVVIGRKTIKSMRGLEDDILINKMKHGFFSKKNLGLDLAK